MCADDLNGIHLPVVLDFAAGFNDAVRALAHDVVLVENIYLVEVELLRFLQLSLVRVLTLACQHVCIMVLQLVLQLLRFQRLRV